MSKSLKKAIVAVLVVVIAIIGFNYERVFLIPKYRKPIIDNVIDPTSVIFKNEVFHDGILCGEFNSKNRMGAYTGFEKFIANPYEVFFDENILRGDTSPLSYWSRFLGMTEALEQMTYEMAKIRALEKNKQIYDEYESVMSEYYAIRLRDYSSSEEYELAKAAYKQKMFFIMWNGICVN